MSANADSLSSDCVHLRKLLSLFREETDLSQEHELSGRVANFSNVKMLGKLAEEHCCNVLLRVSGLCCKGACSHFNFQTSNSSSKTLGLGRSSE